MWFYRKTMYFVFTLSNSCNLVIIFFAIQTCDKFYHKFVLQKKGQSVEIIYTPLKSQTDSRNLWKNGLIVGTISCHHLKMEVIYKIITRLQLGSRAKQALRRPEFHDDRQKLRQIHKQNVKMLKLISLRLVNNQTW